MNWNEVAIAPRQQVDSQDLIESARRGVWAFWGNGEMEDCEFSLDQIEIAFARQYFTHHNDLLSYPYICTQMELTVAGERVGQYTLVTLMDGEIIDDVMEIDEQFNISEEAE